jgi:hypothetical protein
MTGPKAHACDAPGLSPKQFLLHVMHDPDVPIRDRMDAAVKLLRTYGEDAFGPPAFTYRIGGIPPCVLRAVGYGPSSTIQGEGDVTANHSHFSARDHKSSSHSGEAQGPSNIETTIEDISSGNIPEEKLCTICGHYMPYPCSTSKTQIN